MQEPYPKRKYRSTERKNPAKRLRFCGWLPVSYTHLYYSQSLPAAQQGEVAHRYVLGLYRCMEELTRRFPEILFEGCAAGGNRFDPGILCYFPQIWGSDDTDACCRADIQTNYS